MNQELQSITEVTTMSSLDIAKLTKKRHEHVLADIRKMFKELDLQATEFSGVYKNQQLIEYPCFNLPKRECMRLVSGYNLKFRMAIIDRWQKLESKQSQVPSNFLEVMQLATKTLEQNEVLKVERDTAIKNKAEIGSKREATAMNTAAIATKEVNNLKIELDKSK